MAAEPKKRLQLSAVAREARALIYAHRRRLALGFVLLVISRMAGLALPASTKFLIDDVIGRRRLDLLTPLAAVAGGAVAIQAACSFALARILSIAAQRAIADMRLALQAHVLKLPVRYFDSTKSGVLISRIMTDAEGVRNLVGTGVVQLVGGLLTAGVSLGVLLYLNWRLTLATLAVLSVFGVAMAYAFRTMRPLFRERGKINAEVTGRLAETLGGIRIVKAYVAEPREQRVFEAGVDRLFENIAQSITAMSAMTAFSTVIIGVIGVLLLLLGGRAVLNGDMTLGDLVMYFIFTGLTAAPLVEVAAIGTQLTEAFAGLDRIRELRAELREDADTASRRALADVKGEVALRDVWFEYTAGKPVLRGVSFDAPVGTTTALVGSSGSGKSTLINLIMGFHAPTTGAVFVDGHDLRTLRLESYRASLGVVLQDNFLFDGTIAENIGFARPDATPAEVEAAARLAHCPEFVEQFELKYDTVVGERGVKLSGGQRQRVAIARAILADPRILILDEATSSLDSESEALIQDGLRSLRRGRTTFVIAHRLSTIRSANQILVIEQGEIVERGTHEALLAANGRYRQLYDRQHDVEQDRFVNPGEIPAEEPAERPAIPAPAMGVTAL